MSRLRAAVGFVFWTMLFGVGLVVMSLAGFDADELSFHIRYLSPLWIKSIVGFCVGISTYALLTRFENRGSFKAPNVGLVGLSLNIVGAILVLIACIQLIPTVPFLYEILSYQGGRDPSMRGAFSMGIAILNVSSTASIGLALLFASRWLAIYRSSAPPEQIF